MKKGAPISASTTPTSSSPGGATTRPITSASSSSDGADQAGVGQQPAVVGAGQRAGQVRDDQADERQRAAGGHRGAREQRDGGDADGAGQGDVLAEAAGDVLAEGERVQAGRVDQRQDQAGQR